ncbi:hypothetical protein BFW01_g10332 [Lasiodiplodia theobromae]|uniref:Uncharacterized protein n=1 Tax=Lasiodiplodia theobromae TaxID=45133 RepID=A0A8H7IMP3_9PEZI|nr:hypothetical protein BFW01_g10332 [Lasiodiplodia theobromae]
MDQDEIDRLLADAKEEIQLSKEQRDNALSQTFDPPRITNTLQRTTGLEIIGLPHTLKVRERHLQQLPAVDPIGIGSSNNVHPQTAEVLQAVETVQADENRARIDDEPHYIHSEFSQKSIPGLHKNIKDIKTVMQQPPTDPPTEYTRESWDRVTLPLQLGDEEDDVERLATADLQITGSLSQFANKLADIKESRQPYIPEYPSYGTTHRRPSDENRTSPERRRKGSAGQAIPTRESSSSRPSSRLTTSPVASPATTRNTLNLRAKEKKALSLDDWFKATNSIPHRSKGFASDEFYAAMDRSRLALELNMMNNREPPRTTDTIVEEQPDSPQLPQLGDDEDVIASEHGDVVPGEREDHEEKEDKSGTATQDKGKGRATAEEQLVPLDEDMQFEVDMQRIHEEEELQAAMEESRRETLDDELHGQSSSLQAPRFEEEMRQPGERQLSGGGMAVESSHEGSQAIPASQRQRTPQPFPSQRHRTPLPSSLQPQGPPLPLNQDMLKALGGKQLKVRVYQGNSHDDRKIQALIDAAPATATKLMEYINKAHERNPELSIKWLGGTVGQKSCHANYSVDRGTTNKRVSRFKAGYQCQMCATKKRTCANLTGEHLVILPVIDKYRAGKAWTDIEYWIPAAKEEIGGKKNPPSKKAAAKKWTKR